MIATERLSIAYPEARHVEPLLRYHERNSARFATWNPASPPDISSAAYWKRAIELARELAQMDRSFHFVATEAAGNEVVALVNLNEIVRGVFQAAYLGYSVDGAYEGRGYASEAVRGVIGHGFGELNLHRVMATYAPTNERSGRLLRRLGFTVEGYARDYLFCNGAWRDSILTSLTNAEHRFA